MDWGYYLLETGVYLTILYAFYWLRLRQECFYVLNRVFLLATPILAFIIPFFTIKQALVAPVGNGGFVGGPVNLLQDAIPLASVAPVDSGVDWGRLVLGIYVFGVAFLLFRLLWSLGILLRLYVGGVKICERGITMVWIQKGEGPFSFFRWLFMPRGTPQYEALITHERLHIRQWHSVDVLLLEIVRAFQWFNPFAHLLVRDAKLNHEYLADEQASLNEGAYNYAMLLIGNAWGTGNRLLVNPIFNQTQLKKRINMLDTKKSAGIARLKYLLAVPLVACLLTISAFTIEKDYGFLAVATAKVDVQELLPDYRFRTDFSDSTHKPVRIDQRLILINGVEIDKSTIYGVSKASKIIEYNVGEAREKFGEKGKHGAVEITGDAVEMLTSQPPPPPPLGVDALRTPPEPRNDTMRPLPNRLNPGNNAFIYKETLADTLYVGKGTYTLEFNPDGSTAKIEVDNVTRRRH